MKPEGFKDIPGFEGVYAISRDGKVWSYPREVVFYKEGKLLSDFRRTEGYVNAQLSKNGRTKNYPIHRLVAMTYLPNMENKAQVNHKDGVRHNNKLENLEWVTHSENQLHKFHVLGYKMIVSDEKKRKLREATKDVSKPVRQMKDGKVVGEYSSINEAHRKTKCSAAHISACCSGVRKSHGGFEWSFL